MTHDELLEQLPPGPWRWEQVVPERHPVAPGEPGPAGWGLVAADGAWVLTVDSGLGSPDVWPREFGVDPQSAVARALAMVPDLVAERGDLWVALDEVVDVLRRFDALELPLPETARDLVRVLADLSERLAGESGPPAPAGRSAVDAVGGDRATGDRTRPRAAEASAAPGAKGEPDTTSDESSDDHGTGVDRPDLEGMYEAAPERWRRVLRWALGLEGRVNELELALGQELSPTAGEVLDAARAGDEDAQRIVDAARAEGQRRVAERVEELRARQRERSADAPGTLAEPGRSSARPETDGGTGEG